MAIDYDKEYNNFINTLQGKLNLIKIKVKADASRLKKTKDYVTFRDNYLKYINEYDLNYQYPPTPKAFDENWTYLAKAMNEGRKMVLSLQEYFETKSKDF